MSSYAVTGASRGLGLEYVRQLSATPTNTVFAIVRRPETATNLQALAASRPNIHVLAADVTDPAALTAAAASTSLITGSKLDVLIHNAADIDYSTFGILPSQLPHDKAGLTALFEQANSTNLYAAVWVTNAFLPLIENGKQKKIIHISTGMADLDFIKKSGIAYGVAYSMAKAAMNVVTAKFAAELASQNIKLLALSPGWVDTYEGPRPKPDMLLAGEQQMLKEFQRVTPELRGPMTPEQSVIAQLDLISKLDLNTSGSFLSHRGTKEW